MTSIASSICMPFSSCDATFTRSSTIDLTPDRWLWTIPTITGLALATIFVPYFGIGIVVGVIDLTLSVVALKILEKLHIIEEEDEDDDQSSQYAREIYKNPFLAACVAPILEEGIMRGTVQPMLSRVIQQLVPASTAMFANSGLSIATSISILSTSMLFGAAHLSNPHKKAHVQAVLSGVSGIVLGLLAAKFGLGASIASHIVNNSLALVFFSAKSDGLYDLPKVHPIHARQKQLPTIPQN